MRNVIPRSMSLYFVSGIFVVRENGTEEKWSRRETKTRRERGADEGWNKNDDDSKCFRGNDDGRPVPRQIAIYYCYIYSSRKIYRVTLYRKRTTSRNGNEIVSAFVSVLFCFPSLSCIKWRARPGSGVPSTTFHWLSSMSEMYDWTWNKLTFFTGQQHVLPVIVCRLCVAIFSRRTRNRIRRGERFRGIGISHIHI